MLNPDFTGVILNSGNFSLYSKIILFFYHMTQIFSGLLKFFWIAMLLCYQGFSLSAGSILLRQIRHTSQYDQSCSAKSGTPPTLINPTHTNQAIRQIKAIWTRYIYICLSFFPHFCSSVWLTACLSV